MVVKESSRRTGDCRIKLAPDMMERLEALAKANGFPVATMAAVAVGEWVNTKEQAQRNQRMLMLDVGRQIGGGMQKMFEAMADDPEVQVVSEGIAKRLQGQGDLPLDSSGTADGSKSAPEAA